MISSSELPVYALVLSSSCIAYAWQVAGMSNQKASQDASRNPFLPTPSYMRQHFTYQPLRKLEGTQPWYTPVTEPVSHASIPHYIFNMVSLAAIGLRSRDGSAPYGSRACSG